MSRRQRDFIDPCPVEGICRRELLLRATRLLSLGTAGAVILDANISQVHGAPSQNDWAHCVNCNMLFFNGYKDKGRCPVYGVPAKAAHMAEKAGSSFKKYQITYDDSTGPGQGDWRFCRKCSVLFFNGYPEKGVCPADHGGHEAAGWNFFLYHDRQRTIDEEDGWRYCTKCHSLFYTRTSNKVGCPADGKGHQPAGYRFVVGQKGLRFD